MGEGLVVKLGRTRPRWSMISADSDGARQWRRSVAVNAADAPSMERQRRQPRPQPVGGATGQEFLLLFVWKVNRRPRMPAVRVSGRNAAGSRRFQRDAAMTANRSG